MSYHPGMLEIASDQRVGQLVSSLAASLSDRMADGSVHPWAMVGIKRRGDLLARRLAAQLRGDPLEGRVGSLDITLYRDDLSEIANQPIVKTSDIPFDLDGLNLVLVDDVLMSGRSVRAALQSLMDFGRPRRIWLAVLVDRGGRELPICPDHCALDLTTHPDGGIELNADDRVLVHLTPLDGGDRITVEPAANEKRG